MQARNQRNDHWKSVISPQREDKMNLKKYLLLSWKKILIMIAAVLLSVFLHNVISGLFDIEEVVFFILAVIIIPLYFIISVVYTFMIIIKKKINKR